jgi:hypothetical protein
MLEKVKSVLTQNNINDHNDCSLLEGDIVYETTVIFMVTAVTPSNVTQIISKATILTCTKICLTAVAFLKYWDT